MTLTLNLYVKGGQSKSFPVFWMRYLMYITFPFLIVLQSFRGARDCVRNLNPE